MVGRKEWAADDVLSAADLEGYLMDQVVTIWANATARNSGILAPIEGQISYIQDSNLYQTWDGSSWVGLSVASADNANKVGGITIFNSSTTPTANAAGDLWFTRN